MGDTIVVEKGACRQQGCRAGFVRQESSNECSVGGEDEIPQQRLKRAPSAVVDCAENANGAPWLLVPENLNFYLIGLPRSALQLSDLCFTQQGNEVTVVATTVAIQMIAKKTGGFLVVHVSRLSNAMR